MLLTCPIEASSYCIEEGILRSQKPLSTWHDGIIDSKNFLIHSCMLPVTLQRSTQRHMLIAFFLHPHFVVWDFTPFWRIRATLIDRHDVSKAPPLIVLNVQEMHWIKQTTTVQITEASFDARWKQCPQKMTHKWQYRPCCSSTDIFIHYNCCHKCH